MEILAAVKGSDKEKRLASQFIAKFFNSFPNLAEQAIEAQFDLCEDDDVAVSTLLIAIIAISTAYNNYKLLNHMWA